MVQCFLDILFPKYSSKSILFQEKCFWVGECLWLQFLDGSSIQSYKFLLDLSSTMVIISGEKYNSSEVYKTMWWLQVYK